MTWSIKYYNGSAWVPVPNAVLDQIIDELNGQLELDFIIPNTPANLSFVQADQQIQVFWGSTNIFNGLLRAYKIGFIKLATIVYNDTFEVMKKRQITGKYQNAAANTIFAAICAAAGMTPGSCPTTVVSTQFNATECYIAALNLANILGLNLYNVGTVVNISVKGNQTPTAITVDTTSEVNIDRSKAGYDGVLIRGIDQAGNTITGSAGNTSSGYNVKNLTNKIAMDQASLNRLASAYIESLQETNSGSPLECDISQAALLSSGDIVTVTNGAALGLSGNYAIYRITKNLTKASIEIVRPVNIFDNLINAMADSTTALNTLPVGSDQFQGSNVSTQNLVGFFHADEGQGTIAKDASSFNNDAIISSGCTWVQGPVTKVLMFKGIGSYIKIPNIVRSSVDFGGLSAMSFSVWFSPTVAASQYLVNKANQFYVQLQANGVIVFGLFIGGSWAMLTAPAGTAPLNGRLFGAFIYDGSKMYIYLNGPVVTQQAQTGVIGSSTSDTFLGAQNTTVGGLTGVEAEVMFFSRAISSQEVYSLCNFPLVSLNGSGTKTGGSNVSIVRIRPNIQTKTAFMPTTEYIKSECIQADGTIVAAPTGKVVSYEAGYVALALMAKNESGCMTLVQKILDAYVLLQNSDGSWYQQYDPTINVAGTHDRAAMVDDTHSGDLKVDSGCAMLIHAMSDWDRLNGQMRYETVVRLGLMFLHTLSYDHTLADGNNMLANLIYQGQVDTMAFSADTAECLLAMQAALDAYGDSLTGSDGYSTKTLANGVFYGLVAYAYRGDAFRAYMTTNPINSQCLIPFDYKENISYAQAITAIAVKEWSVSSHNTVGDFSGQAEKVLDQTGAFTNGQWGGQLYVPYYGNSDENQDEYTVYSAFVCLAMQAINSAKYAGRITQLKDFVKLMTNPQGQSYDVCESNGDLYISKLNAPGQPLKEGYGFITLTAAMALYSGTT